jgi:methylenetetrahydrofolate reductase (NADPH)
VERFEEWFAPARAAGIPERAPVLVGVSPPRSLAALRYMHDNIPGIEVDDATFSQMEGLRGAEAQIAGIEIAVAVVTGVRALDGVAGVHLMAPGWEREAVPALVRESEIGPAIRRN